MKTSDTAQHSTAQHSTIHIVISVYDPRGTYSRHAGVLAASVFANTKEPVCLHILHDKTFSVANREKFLSLAQTYNQKVDLIDISEKIDLLDWDVDRITIRFTRGSLFRLRRRKLLALQKQSIWIVTW